MNYIFMGPPGSGKSTQAKRLAQAKNLYRISSGEIIRQLNPDSSPQAQQAFQYYQQGTPVPNDLMLNILREHLEKIREEITSRQGVILDGFPYNLEQAQLLEKNPEIIPENKINQAIYINTTYPECLKRLTLRSQKENRLDDTPEVIEQRFVHYKNRIDPVLNFYRQKGILVEINGDPSEEEVYQALLQKIQTK